MKVVYLGIGDEVNMSFAFRRVYKKLTIGKSYNIVNDDDYNSQWSKSVGIKSTSFIPEIYDDYYLIKNDIYEIVWYDKKYFITLDKYRNLKIDEVLK